jgi:hypothetical protein
MIEAVKEMKSSTKISKGNLDAKLNANDIIINPNDIK